MQREMRCEGIVWYRYKIAGRTRRHSVATDVIAEHNHWLSQIVLAHTSIRSSECAGIFAIRLTQRCASTLLHAKLASVACKMSGRKLPPSGPKSKPELQTETIDHFGAATTLGKFMFMGHSLRRARFHFILKYSGLFISVILTVRVCFTPR